MPWSTRSLPQAPYASYAGQSLLADRQPEAVESGPHEVPVWMGPLRHSEGMFSTFVHNNEQQNITRDRKCKIVHYDFDAVCRWGGFLGLFTRAGICRISWSLTTCLGLTLTLALTTGGVVAWANDESKMDTDAMEALQQRTLLIVTFIMGFFVQLNISRWWNHREFLRTLHGTVLDVLLLLSTSGATQEQLQCVARLGLLSQALLFDECRGTFENAQANGAEGPFSGLVKMGLLKEQEIPYLADRAQKAQTVWLWIASYVKLWLNDDKKAYKIQKRCCNGRAAISAIRTQLGTQLPYTYVQLISVMVQCNHCIMGLGCGYTGAAALVLGHYALLVAQIAQTVIVPATFQSLLDVCVYVSDPYGSDVIDFSFLSYHLALAKVCESFTSPIPPEFAAKQSPPDARSPG
ncbi:unnamed protein product [Cladocopium goreaui]|uniref:Uncharacterized protein n=1 Tax=Cladocopium goreaui TaxID=2562237 RepID=A0A9P1D0L1_9DINO|nr:unnamed protein product [Cladocopium goreaui]